MLVSDEEFLEQAWRLALQREPDAAGRAEGLERLRSGRISRASYLAELLDDEPFRRVRALDDGVAFARLHRGERPRALTAPAWVGERAHRPWMAALAGLVFGTVAPSSTGQTLVALQLLRAVLSALRRGVALAPRVMPS